MKRRIYDILKGKFLISEDAVKNWKFIVFCTFLAIMMIASSHSTEKKVHDIAKLQKVERQLRSQFVDQRQHLMQLKMESGIQQRLKDKGLSISNEPPHKIIVED